MTADRSVTVTSTNSSVSIASKTHILLTAVGAGIRLEGGNNTLNALSTITFAAGMKELCGPVSVTTPKQALELSELQTKRDLEIEFVDADGNHLTDEEVVVKLFGEQRRIVKLDKQGKTIVKNAPRGPFSTSQPRRQDD